MTFVTSCDRAAAHVPLPKITMSKSPCTGFETNSFQRQNTARKSFPRAAWARCIGGGISPVKPKRRGKFRIFPGPVDRSSAAFRPFCASAAFTAGFGLRTTRSGRSGAQAAQIGVPASRETDQVRHRTRNKRRCRARGKPEIGEFPFRGGIAKPFDRQKRPHQFRVRSLRPAVPRHRT